MTHSLVVVANRLPVDLTTASDGSVTWQRSPGGLVTAMEPVMREADGAWIGWAGEPGDAPPPFEADGMYLVPVGLTEHDLTDFYEGFSNDTLWPLSHDVISPPVYHRRWWEAYRRVNRRFAEAAAAQAAPGGTVWVHDYQLQLVPAMLRELRDDVLIGYFHHIPFPPLELFAQLPWRRQVIEGLLGADLVGFQRSSDAANFLRVVRRWTGLTARAGTVTMAGAAGERRVRAAAFPISIDSGRFDELARSPWVRARAAEIRSDLGDPEVLLLGVDRLDYTKGIRHRVKAVGELFAERRLEVPGAALVQVASPSRENVGAYQQLREEVELLVGRINGEHGRIGAQPIHYLHHSYPPEEMAALYRAADIMLVTSLRDGMNLVAKEFVAACVDNGGVLVLSEFTGAADELGGALLVNPHDIDGLKAAIEQAVTMDPREVRSRMRRLRRRVLTDDVSRWSRGFLAALTETSRRPGRPSSDASDASNASSDASNASAWASGDGSADAALAVALSGLAGAVRADRTVLVALDFDGVLAPLVDTPSHSRATPGGVAALRRLAGHEHVELALVSGRGLADLAEVAEVPDGTVLIGSHGAETGVWQGGLHPAGDVLDAQHAAKLAEVSRDLRDAVAGSTARVEVKPTTAVLHTRGATPSDTTRLTAAAVALGERTGVEVMVGRDIVELCVLSVTKGDALSALRDTVGAAHVLFAGDDVTDERAMATLRPGDVGIRIGDGESAAPYRLAGPDEMADALHRLADLLEG